MLQLENTTVERSGESNNITLVLLGKNSDEKCTIGNRILKAEHFTAGKDTCTRAEERVDDRTVCVINTPELFHKSNTKQETDGIEEIKPLYPGQRAFLLVLHNKQLSPEEMEMFIQLKERFGEKMVENTIVVLVSNQEKLCREPYDQADENLKKLLDECGRRVCVHNQKDNELTKQVMDKWKAIYETPGNELGNATTAEDGLYEEIDPYIPMLPMPPMPPEPPEPRMYQMHQNSKGQSALTSGGDNRLAVVLLGNNSDNKCLIGNTILAKRLFQPQKNTCEKILDTVGGQKVCIINTPDFFHKQNSPDNDRMEELKPTYAGPRAFLLVLQNKRVSSEEMEMFTELKKKLGDKMVENTIVMVEKKSSSMDKQVSFKKHYFAILNECGNRKCTYDKHTNNAELIKQLNQYTQSMQKNQTSEVRSLDNVVAMQTPTNLMSSSVKVHHPTSMTIVLLGQTGSGKSATGNTILKKHHFKSHASSVPVTKTCQVAEEMVFEKKVRVIDTPDFFNEDLQNQEEQIKKCKELALPGPDVYLLVMQLGRFTDGEREVLPHLKREFGEDVTSKTVVLFTGKEKLKDRNLTDYISGSDTELQELIKTCHSRCYAFNNNEKSHPQVKKLLDVIDGMQGNIAAGKPHKKKHKEDCNIL